MGECDAMSCGAGIFRQNLSTFNATYCIMLEVFMVPTFGSKSAGTFPVSISFAALLRFIITSLLTSQHGCLL